MTMAHLSYVVCNACGVPASQPVGNAKEARAMIPADWTRVWCVNRHEDLCPKHSTDRHNRSKETR